MSKFKDFHLYLGQPVKVLFEDEHGKYTVERAGTLSWNHDEDREWIIYQPLPGDDFEDVDFKFKLVLRRLSSMTKQDIDLGEFIPDFEILIQKFTGGYCVEIDSVQDDGYCLTIYPDGSMYCICKDNNENYPYKGGELFNQLLSKGFDLFGLIDAGLAIDAATV